MVRVRRSAWLLGFAFIACRYGYEDLGSDANGTAASGAARAPTAGPADAQGAGAAVGGDGTTGSASESTQVGGNAPVGGDATQTGGTTTQTGGASSQTGGTAGQGAGAGGQTAGATQGGSTGMAGAANCAGAVALTTNAAPTVAPAINCAYPGALVCDDFEGGQKPYWTVVATAPAQAALQSCLVHGGSQALWAHSALATSPIQMQEQLSPTVGSGSLFVRTFVYLPSSASLPNWTVLYEVWDSPTKWTNKLSIDLQPDGTVTLNNWAGQQQTSLAAPAALIPRDQWTCLELEIVVDKVNGATRLYLDDTQVITSTGATRTRGTRAFCTVSLGAVSGDSPIDLYEDDFVVATSRIGCK